MTLKRYLLKRYLVSAPSAKFINQARGFNRAVRSMAFDGTGKLYVGGEFTSYNDAGSNFIIRLNSDGTVDTYFSVGSGFNDYVYSLAPAGDGTGNIYVGGGFTTYGTTIMDRIARLNSDGTAD